MATLSPYDLISANFVTSTLDLACTIQSIPAPTFDEGRRAAFFLDHFKAMGLEDVEQDTIGNVLARLPGQNREARPVIVSAHMDTVFPLETILDVRRQEDRICGPGIGDNALGLAGAIGLVRLLKEKAVTLPGDVWLALNVCEEGLGDLRGIQAVVNRFGSEPLAYIVLEGMGLGTVLNCGLGVERYKISVQTPGGHSWVNYGSPSAIHELCKIVDALARLDLPKNPCTSLNVGVIQGGTSVNTIAAHAWMELDLRSEDGYTLSSLVKEVYQVAERAQRPGVAVNLERIGKRLAGQLSPGHPLALLAQQVLNDLGLEARLDIASTDANLPLSRGYPAICLGLTSGNNAHTMEEYILTAPVAFGMAQLYLLITRLWDKL